MHHVSPIHRLKLAFVALFRVAIVLRLRVFLDSAALSPCNHLDLLSRSLNADPIYDLHHFGVSVAIVPSVLILVILALCRYGLESLALLLGVDLS